MLALSFELRVAAASAAAAGEHDVNHELEQAFAATASASGDRGAHDIAHGIFPVVLTTAGLAAALDAIRDNAAVALELDVSDDRLDPLAKMAAYLAVVESVHAAADADIASVSVVGRQHDDRFRLAVDWADGVQPVELFTHVADRVGALDGELSVSGASSEVVLPCAPS